MTIFLIYTFKEPEVLGRVCRALTPGRVLVHVDAKVDAAPFVRAVGGEAGRVEFVADRTLVNWAGYSQVRAIRSLVKRGLEVAAGDDEYLVMLSGQDYPIKPAAELNRFFFERQGTQFLRAFKVSGTDPHFEKQTSRRFYRDLPLLAGATGRPSLRRLRNATIRSLELLARGAPRRAAPDGLVVAHGGTHFALTAGCLRQLEAKVTPKIERFFARSFCPEEKFYHSLLATYSSTLVDCSWHLVPYVGLGQWRYANLHVIDPTLVKVYTEQDFPKLAESDRFFVRKVESKASRTLLDRIDAELLQLPT